MTATLLAIDTSTENCSAALVADDQLYQRVAESPREHSQRLLPFVDEVLAEAGISLAGIDGLVVGCGPGSFTGVRIGVSVAQGLAFSVSKPVYPVSSLQALAQQSIRRSSDSAASQLSPQLILASIDARMAEVYYENVNGIAIAITEPAVAKPDEHLFADIVAQLSVDNTTPVAAVGTGWDQYRDVLAANLPLPLSDIGTVRLPEAEDMLALVQAQQINPVNAAELEPLYVRNEVTWKKLPGR